MTAVESGRAPLQGIRLTIIKDMDAYEAAFCACVKLGLPRRSPIEIFLEVEPTHLRDDGALDLTHAVTGALYARMPA
jgi:hypothetical protein